MRLVECEQRSEAWFQARCGVPTASNFDKIVTSKGEPSKQREKYLYQLAGEFVTGVPTETYQNANMIRGNELEAEAREYYSFVKEVEVQTIGFCLEDGGKFGASPDALIGDKGLAQFKCPLISTHVGYLLENKLPTDYVQQTQGELLVTGREYNDFVSYYPGLKLFVVRVERDEVFLKKLEMELRVFCEELREVVEKIR